MGRDADVDRAALPNMFTPEPIGRISVSTTPSPTRPSTSSAGPRAELEWRGIVPQQAEGSQSSKSDSPRQRQSDAIPPGVFVTDDANDVEQSSSLSLTEALKSNPERPRRSELERCLTFTEGDGPSKAGRTTSIKSSHLQPLKATTPGGTGSKSLPFHVMRGNQSGHNMDVGAVKSSLPVMSKMSSSLGQLKTISLDPFRSLVTGDEAEGDKDVITGNNQIKERDDVHQVMRRAAIDAWLRENQTAEEECVSETRMRIRRVVGSIAFNVVCVSVIVLNIAYLGAETDYNKGKESWWLYIDVSFTCFFCVELAFRVAAAGSHYFKDGFNLMDVTLVLLGAVDSSFTVAAHASDSGGDPSVSLNFLMAVRVLRLLRVARVLRLLRFFKELWLIVTGVVQSGRTVCWAWALILLILYIAGIFMTRTMGKVYGDVDPLIDKLFGTVPRSMFSMFVVVTSEEWPTYCRTAMTHEPYIWLFFVFFMALTTFGVLNVVTAVIVESTLDQALRNQEDVQKLFDQDKQRALQNIHYVFQCADRDGNGELTKDEFMAALGNPEVVGSLHAVDIDMNGAESLFDILDYDCSGNLDVKEFLQGCLRARGPAKAKDVLAAQCDLWRAQSRMGDILAGTMSEWNERFDRLDHAIAEVKVLSHALWIKRAGDSKSSKDASRLPGPTGSSGAAPDWRGDDHLGSSSTTSGLIKAGTKMRSTLRIVKRAKNAAAFLPAGFVRPEKGSQKMANKGKSPRDRQSTSPKDIRHS